jgi:hypothetical protein
MRVFKYWTQLRDEAEWNGKKLPISAFGGSDRSIDDAKTDAQSRLQRIVERIRTGRRSEEGYEADIREEPLERIDASNVITRNRYGVEVLNSTDHCFVDIDFLPGGCLWILLGRKSREKQMAGTIEFLEKRANHPRMQGLALRIYETRSGLRVLVTGRNFAPAAPETQELMEFLRADWLYTALCRRQGCFRARLTPKPYRMKTRTMRFIYPRSAEVDAEIEGWVREYNERSQQYATCRYLKTIGQVVSDPIITLHDDRTGAHSGRRLA